MCRIPKVASCGQFWTFHEIFVRFFGKILKSFLFQNHLASCFEIAQRHFWVTLDLNLATRCTVIFSLFFEDSLHVFFSIFNICGNVGQIVLKTLWTYKKITLVKLFTGWCYFGFLIFNKFFNLGTPVVYYVSQWAI